jgi:hypothetical protein
VRITVPKNPLAKIKDVADVAVSVAVGAGQKVAGQVVGTAVTAVGAVSSKVPGQGKPVRPAERPTSPAVPQQAEAKRHGDPVAPAKAPVRKATGKKAPAKKLASAGKLEIPTPDETALAASAKKAPVKKAPVKKAPVKKAPTKKAAPSQD